jgi:hypothetical protein
MVTKYPFVLASSCGHESVLFLDEDVYVTLYGAAVDVNVRLDKNTLKLENTFISCTSQRYATWNLKRKRQKYIRFICFSE